MEARKRKGELVFVIAYAIFFYTFFIRRSLHISNSYSDRLFGLRSGWIAARLNDVSDAQWRNFRSNLPILTVVFGVFTLFDAILGTFCKLKSRGKSIYWLVISLAYLLYLHGACIIFILTIATANFCLVKCFGRTQFFSPFIWIFTIGFLISSRVYEGYSFSNVWKSWSNLDNFRGTFRWQICFNFVILRMLSFAYDFHWALDGSNFDYKRHLQHCASCKSGNKCYQLLQEKNIGKEKFNFIMYLCYLLYAPLYFSGPVVSFNAFASQINGIQTPENMPGCINNCHSLETFWKNWHSSYNKWLVRYMYIPLGGSQRKMMNIWVIFTFVALWHDLEWKLLSWAWITCLIFVPEMAIKSASKSFEVEHVFGKFIFRELRAVCGTITITGLMVANIVGYVIGLSRTRQLASRFFGIEGSVVLLGMLVTFYIGTKLMFHIDEAKNKRRGAAAVDLYLTK